MIESVGTVSVFVQEQQRAKEFYTQVLGLELRHDEPLFPGAQVRWLTVAPAGAETEIVLYIPDEHWAHYQGVVGKAQAVTLKVPQLEAYVAQLEEKGVVFIEPFTKQGWGSYAIIEDSEGNRLVLSQPQEKKA